MSLLETNRQKMAEIAQGILDGRISIIAGALEIHALFCGHVGIDEQDPDLNTFVAIDGETDDLPIGRRATVLGTRRSRAERCPDCTL